MAIIERKDVIDDSALAVLPEFDGRLGKIISTAEGVIKSLLGIQEAAGSVKSISEITEQTEKLAAAEKISRRTTEEWAAAINRAHREKDKERQSTQQNTNEVKKEDAAKKQNKKSTDDGAKSNDNFNKKQKEVNKSLKEGSVAAGFASGAMEGLSDQVSKAGGNMGPLDSGLRIVSSAMGGVAKSSNLLKIALLSIPLVLIATALVSLAAYFKGTEEGAQKFRIAMAALKGVGDAVADVLKAVGKWLTELARGLIESPWDKFTQGVKGFGNAIKDFIIDRIKLVLEGFTGLGKAAALFFKGEFSEAAKLAGDSLLQIAKNGTPVGIAMGLIADAADTVSDAFDKLYDEASKKAKEFMRIQRLENQLMVDRRNFLVEEERLINAVNVARERAADSTLSNQERLDAMLETEQAMDKLANARIGLARRELSIALARKAAGEDDEQALQHIAELQKEILAIENQRLAEQRRITSQRSNFIRAIQAEEERAAKEAMEARIKAAKDEAEAIFFEQKKRFDREVVLIKQNAKSKEEVKEQLEAAEKQLTINLIEENIKRLQRILMIEELSADERLKIEKELYDAKLALTDAYFNALGEREKTGLEKTKEFIGKVEEIYNTLASSIGNAFAAITTARMTELDNQLAHEEEVRDRLLEQYGDDATRREEIEQRFAEKQAAIEEQKRKAQQRQAKFDKAVALVGAIINTARGVTAALSLVPPLSFILAGLVGAAGAVQIAAIAKTPIPAFEKGGTTKTPIVKVGERGRELLTLPGGRKMLSPDSPTIMALPVGTHVTDHKTTMRQLALAGLVRSGGDTLGEGGTIKELRAINSTIKNKREVVIQGRVTGYRQGAARVKYIEQLRNR